LSHRARVVTTWEFSKVEGRMDKSEEVFCESTTADQAYEVILFLVR
jgi:hypothetical protein